MSNVLNIEFFVMAEDYIAARLEKLIYSLGDNALEHGMSVINSIETDIKVWLAKEIYAELDDDHSIVGADVVKDLDLKQGILRIAVICPYHEKEDYVENPRDGYAIALFKIFLKSSKWGSYNLTIFGANTKSEADENVREFLYSLAVRTTVSSGKWFENGREDA